MSKIYSRPRLRIPKIVIGRQNNSYKYKRNRTKRKRIILVIIVISIITLKLVLNSVIPIFDELCENKAISLATRISNKKATELMKNYSYDQLFTIEKDENGNITMMNLNVMPMNEMTSKVAIMIQEGIDEEGNDSIEIPFRKFYRFQIISRYWT